MKVLRSAAGVALVFIFLFSLQANFSSCKKDKVVTDTITVHVKDTLTIIDSSYNLKDGLVAYYNFNGGTLNDSSGNGNTITLNNNAVKTADRYGRANNAYLFNGTDSYMKVANSNSLNSFTNQITIMATIKINGFYSANCVNNQIIGKGWNDFINGYYALRFYSTVGCQNTVDTSKEVFNGSYGDLNTRAADYDQTFIHTNTWYNVVYTSSYGQSKIYINGVLKSVSNATASSTSFTPNSQEMYIGKHGDPQYPYLFNGVIDELRIYNKVLPPRAVKQLYETKQ
jgi:hypothetical protein